MTETHTLVAGRYRVIRALGAGGMGRVWLARDEVLDRDVAIKEIVLPFGLPDTQREELRLRTLREARAAARLSHPNVVQIYDVQSGDDQPWIVMEYVRSRSLLQVIEENGPLPVEQVAGIGLAVLSALDAANRVGVLHRDVKPSNVLIADDGRVVLTDFGSAMIDEGEGALTRTGVILGSPQFIAPERVDKGVSTPEADLWSLGATLYAAVEGRPPYSRSTALRSLIALTTDKPDPIRLGGPLKPVLTGLLQRNPQARMKPVDIEQRLRRLADVQTTVHLRHIPEQRTGEAGVPALAAVAAAGAIPALEGGSAKAAGAGAAGAVPEPPGLSEQRTVGTVLRARWRILAATVAAAVVIPLAALAGSAVYPQWTSVFDDDQPDRTPVQAAAGPGAGTARLPSGAPSATPSQPAAATLPKISLAGFDLPSTYRWWSDRNGYRIAYPANYSHQRENPTVMFFCAPGGPPTIRIQLLDDAGSDLAAVLSKEERKGTLPRYERIRLGSTGQNGEAVWEYRFTDPKAGRLHAVERAFVRNGQTYVIQWRTPVKKWAAQHKTYGVVVNSFTAV
jgi:predicted Ser/Thr protein kinase